ncbi:IS630 family transposase [Alteromonas pelagimontana]|uniref:IS630 family transposase n=1 Tax=Alteromonas pelagimontana TaxID=1858656 RepID=A0A6M4MAA3_9ALTE|nr:IS630 family transposase [Alteromonas pelagimontana]QJR80102.1 IS630 family transposase [Alteromonas pelagimontana]
MNRISLIDRPERRRLEKIVQRSKDKRFSRRANAVLLVSQGHTRSRVAKLLSAARSSVNRWCKWYSEVGIEGLKDAEQGKPAYLPGAVIVKLLHFLIPCSPQDLGYQRSRWSTELLSNVMFKHAGIQVHSSTLRRWMPELGIVWRRAAPTLRIRDPHKEEKLAAIKAALDKCDADNPVFYEDEVDIHLNPKIGADWGFKGKQRLVPTPGRNEKYYLAGALHAGTGAVKYVGSHSKCSELFIKLMVYLRKTYRKAKTITLIVDNYIIHKSRKTQAWLKQNPKFTLLFQPVYSPWVNKIEKLWHALHETVTRNHRCSQMWELLQQVRRFMETASPFPGNQHGLAEV